MMDELDELSVDARKGIINVRAEIYGLESRPVVSNLFYFRPPL